MEIKTVGIVGLGLIGGSLAKTMKKTTNAKVYGIDTDSATMQKATLLGAIDGVLDDTVYPSLDLLIVALYPAAIVKYLSDNAHLIPRGCVVVDCGGIKREICKVGRECADRYGFTFIGGHPMAGREVWGFSHAVTTLFTGASMILTPDGDIDIAILAAVRDFFLTIGFGKITIRTASEHDRIIAYTSQLAHVLSSAYIKSPSAPEHRGLSAGSFKDMTRVATINGDMWCGIFIENRDYLLTEIDTLIKNLTEYRAAIEAGDAESLGQMLDEGSEMKKKCFAKETPQNAGCKSCGC